MRTNILKKYQDRIKTDNKKNVLHTISQLKETETEELMHNSKMANE
jgi:hypothetical protein